MSKSSSPSEVPDSRIFMGYCGAKGSGCLGPFRIISPRAQLGRKRSRMTKEGSKLLREIAKERHVFGKLVS